MSDDDAYKRNEGCVVLTALSCTPPNPPQFNQPCSLCLLLCLGLRVSLVLSVLFFFSYPVAFLLLLTSKAMILTFFPLVIHEVFFYLLQICVLLFTCLYIVCYLILTHFKKTAEFVTGGSGSHSRLLESRDGNHWCEKHADDGSALAFF